jgi:hypothetical protein
MRLLAITCLIIICSCSSAQEVLTKFSAGLQINTIPARLSVNYNPYGGYWEEQKDLYSGPGIVVSDYSFSPGLVLSTRRKNNNVWRMRAGVIRTNVQSGWNYTDPSFYYAYSARKKQLDYYIAPGIYKTFSVFKFSYHAGLELPVTVYGPANVSKIYTYSSVSTGEMLYLNEITGKINNGYSFGLAPFAGFMINLSQNFSFGPEVGFALLFSDYGSRGEFRTSTMNGVSYQTAESFNPGYRKAGISQPYGSFIASYQF